MNAFRNKIIFTAGRVSPREQAVLRAELFFCQGKSHLHSHGLMVNTIKKKTTNLPNTRQPYLRFFKIVVAIHENF